MVKTKAHFLYFEGTEQFIKTFFLIKEISK